MSAEHERAERLAMESWPITADLSDDVEQYRERAAFVDGYLASKRLTDAEWDEKREQVARALAKSEQPSQPWDHHGSADQNWYRDDALAAMIALGFTRTSEPGGDT